MFASLSLDTYSSYVCVCVYLVLLAAVFSAVV